MLKKKLIKSVRRRVGHNGKKRSKKLNLSELRKSRETLVEKLNESFKRLYDYASNIKDSLPEDIKDSLSLVGYTKLDKIHIFYVGEAKRFNKLPNIGEKINLDVYGGYMEFRKIFEDNVSKNTEVMKKLIRTKNCINNVTDMDKEEYNDYFNNLEKSRKEFKMPVNTRYEV